MIVNARAGPRARKNGEVAASSVAVPAATATPATPTIGPDLAIARTVASRTGNSERRSSLSAAQKNTT